MLPNLSQRDAKAVWHPFSPQLASHQPDNIPIVKAEGSLLYTSDGKQIIDAVSSWWVSVHGHCHPHILSRVKQQLDNLDHVIFAGFTHHPAVELAEQLLQIVPGNYDKVFFSDNGSTAVEVGLKMALQYWYNTGKPRKQLIAFRHAYHGDTFGAMALGERGVFNIPFESFFFETVYIDLPDDDNYHAVNQQFEKLISSKDTAAFIFEPLILGSGGMLMYRPEHLNRLIGLAREHGVLCIADEVMTGFYRTGTMFATEQLSLKPDIICLSKGLSGGIMPLGATLCNKEVTAQFVSDDKSKALYHGHSYTGNPIACTAALAGLELFNDILYKDKIKEISNMHEIFKVKLDAYERVANCRSCGVVLAFEIITEEPDTYFNSIRDRLYQAFIDRGVLIRPLGNTVYIMPPYVITREQLLKVYDAILDVLTSRII